MSQIHNVESSEPALGSAEIAVTTQTPWLDAEEGEKSRCLSDFLRTLFRLLDDSEVRYCVLHSWTKLPEEIQSDLDIGVHQEDSRKLLPVFEGLRDQGYIAFQCLNYKKHCRSCGFFWIEASAVRAAAVDIAFEHRRGNLKLMTGAEMVTERQWNGLFWTSSPRVEFAYLLAKKVGKGSASETQQLRLQELVSELGIVEAEKTAKAFLPSHWCKRVVHACTNRTLLLDIGKGRAMLWRIAWTRHPVASMEYLASELFRIIRRFAQPTGLVLAVLGSDGTGKSTVIAELVKTFGIAFRNRHRVNHWRPNVLARKKLGDPVPNPHGTPPRGAAASIVHLLVFFADYWAGYLFSTRCLTAKSNLVVFDRYFQDILVDPLRYRYGGPKWFSKLLSRFVPKPNLVIILEADPDIISARKPEVSTDETRRQSAEYRELSFGHVTRVFVRTDTNPQSSFRAASVAVVRFMRQRFEERYQRWLCPRA
jgi:thymidylate kinase